MTTAGLCSPPARRLEADRPERANALDAATVERLHADLDRADPGGRAPGGPAGPRPHLLRGPRPVGSGEPDRRHPAAPPHPHPGIARASPGLVGRDRRAGARAGGRRGGRPRARRRRATGHPCRQPAVPGLGLVPCSAPGGSRPRPRRRSPSRPRRPDARSTLPKRPPAACGAWWVPPRRPSPRLDRLALAAAGRPRAPWPACAAPPPRPATPTRWATSSVPGINARAARPHPRPPRPRRSMSRTVGTPRWRRSSRRSTPSSTATTTSTRLVEAVADRLRAALAAGIDLPASVTRPSQERYVMYVDPAGRFSIASAVWNVGQGTPVHGHETWGVVGIHSGVEHEVVFAKPTAQTSRWCAVMARKYSRSAGCWCAARPTTTYTGSTARATCPASASMCTAPTSARSGNSYDHHRRGPLVHLRGEAGALSPPSITCVRTCLPDLPEENPHEHRPRRRPEVRPRLRPDAAQGRGHRGGRLLRLRRVGLPERRRRDPLKYRR